MSKILLVEDNEINRDMLSRRLERKGYEVVVAIDGAQAVAKTRSDRPDLVLMDLHLPVLDGWEATRQIKANPQTSVIPVIALTADALAGEREKALAAGCDDYDTKPVDLPKLLEKMSKLLEAATSPPDMPLPSDTLSLPSDPQLHRRLRNRLRHELTPFLHSIIGYSALLLDTLSSPAASGQSDSDQQSLYDDIQKLFASGNQLLQLVHAVLSPALVDIQQPEINLVAPHLRRELLTPLSTIIGYCEMLLEEAPADLMLDLEAIYTSAQALLSKVSGLDSLVKQHLESIHSSAAGEKDISAHTLESANAKALVRQRTLEIHRSLATERSQILVVDSDVANGTLLSRQLERQGAQVAIASTAQQALQAIATTPHDLVLLTATPSGLQLLEQIKCSPETPNIPVLMIANPAEMAAVAQGMAMGAADYLTRPVQPVVLRTKVANCLAQKRLQNQPGSFDSLLENAPVGVYRASVEGRFRYVNPSLVKLLGYPTAATLLDTVTDIASQLYVDSGQYAEFKHLLETQEKITGFECQVYRHDGDLIWVSQSARAVRDASGMLIYYEGIVEEITQRKLAEATLTQKLDTLQHELAHVKQAWQAAEIVQTDYFQQLHSGDEAQGEPAASPPAELPVRVLLVEDNELNSDMLSRRLRRSGYEVVVASDGAEGVAKALSDHPHVILMDISLPVMDGWEATQQLKADAQTCHIPVIALTAHAMAGDREKALAAGCDDYDTKPIDLPRLLSKIETCLKRPAIS
ncbi:MAG: response regulator [Phormidesmis sp.]